jgi:hypothetical protein
MILIPMSGREKNLTKVQSCNYKELGARYVMHWNKDSFWVATRYNGIQLLTVNDGHVNLVGTIDKAKGLSNDFIETLLRIDNNKVAVGTASGLDIITLSGVH